MQIQSTLTVATALQDLLSRLKSPTPRPGITPTPPPAITPTPPPGIAQTTPSMGSTTNGVIDFLARGTWQANLSLAVIILVVLTAVILILVITLGQGRRVSLWGVKIGPRMSNAGSGPGSPLDSMIAKVRSPRSGASVNRGFRVEGTFEKLPDGYELWVATTDGTRYWPQSKAIIRDDGSWVAQVNYIGGPSGGGTFAVFAVGPDGQALLSQWKEITAHWKKHAPARTPSAPLTRLTRDMRRCHEIDVVGKIG